MKKRLITILLAIILLIGCQISSETGEKEINPETAAKIDVVTAEIDHQIQVWGPAATSAFPPAAGILGIIGLITGAWQKRRSNRAHGATEALVSGIEEFKKTHPQDWKKLKAKLKVGPTAENIIRAIRNLPENS